MKEEDLIEGEWYKITGDGFTDEDFICFHSKHNYCYSYTQCVDGGNFEHRSGHWGGVEIEYVSPMTEAQKVEYLPKYKTNKLGWCRTEVRDYYVFVIATGPKHVLYSNYVSENTYYEKGESNWETADNMYACPLTEDEIEEFITPYLPEEEEEEEEAFSEGDIVSVDGKKGLFEVVECIHNNVILKNNIYWNHNSSLCTKVAHVNDFIKGEWYEDSSGNMCRLLNLIHTHDGKIKFNFGDALKIQPDNSCKGAWLLQNFIPIKKVETITTDIKGLHVPEGSFIYDENDQDAICDMCVKNLDTNRGTCEGSKCEQAQEMFYEETEPNIDFAKRHYPPGTVVEHMYEANEHFTIKEDTIFTEDVDGSIFIQYEDKRLWIFEGGVWADIVTETDLEKAARLYPIGTKYISPENGNTYRVEKAPHGAQYWTNRRGCICADTGVEEGEFIFFEGKWAEIIKSPNLDMTGLPNAHVENLHDSVKEFLVDTTNVDSYDQSRAVPVGEPYMGYLSDSQKAGLKGQQRVPNMTGGINPFTLEDLEAQAKEMGLQHLFSKGSNERVAGMHNPPISLYDGLNWMLPTDKKRGSEKIEIFIKK